MRKIIAISIIVIIALLVLTGCGSVAEQKSNYTDTSANTTIGYIKLYIPSDYTYRPDLRGLMYTESESKQFVKGNANDRSSSIIIDIMVEDMMLDQEMYINTVNENLGENIYKLVSQNPIIYYRDKYEGENGTVTIYNYAFKIIYNNSIHTITISGPSTMEEDLIVLKNNIKDSFKIEN